MPNVTRLHDLCTGHGGYPPRRNDEASPNVYCNNIPVHRQSDHWEIHHDDDEHHDAELALGASKVYVNNLQMGRIGDPLTCGSAVATGSPNVFAGT